MPIEEVTLVSLHLSGLKIFKQEKSTKLLVYINAAVKPCPKSA